MTRSCDNYVQVVEVVTTGGETIIIANVYDRHTTSETNRPTQKAVWGETAKHKRVIIARDMNAHSKLWNPKVCWNIGIDRDEDSELID